MRINKFSISFVKTTTSEQKIKTKNKKILSREQLNAGPSPTISLKDL